MAPRSISSPQNQKQIINCLFMWISFLIGGRPFLLVRVSTCFRSVSAEVKLLFTILNSFLYILMLETTPSGHKRCAVQTFFLKSIGLLFLILIYL
jgi:cation transport ATPase